MKPALSSLAVAMVLFTVVSPSPARAQAVAGDWPVKPIRLIVPFAPGGIADNSARAIADRLGSRLGHAVIVENRAGASGNIGTEAVARSAADGHTLLLGFDGTMVINPHVFNRLPFDTLKDFAPITKLGDSPLIVVAHPSLPVKSLKDLLALSRRKPGSLTYGSSGTGGTPHLACEMLNQLAGTDLTHVPYKGGGAAVADAVGGHIPLVCTAIATAQQFLRDGKLRALAVTSARRSPALPEVPTFIEAGFAGFSVESWVGVLAPARTPRPVVERLQREIAATLQSPEVRERYAVLGIEPVGNGPDEFAAQIRADLARWEKVVKKANIRID